LLLLNFLKAEIYYKSGEFLEAINCTYDLFQQLQTYGEILSSYDTLIIRAQSLVMLGKLSKGETVVEQAETLLEKIKL
jgi:hypothetical protein